MNDVSIYQQRLELLKEWVCCCVDGQMPYFNGTFWSDIIYPHVLSDDVLDELANVHDIWIHAVISPRLIGLKYPFDQYCAVKNFYNVNA